MIRLAFKSVLEEFVGCSFVLRIFACLDVSMISMNSCNKGPLWMV